MKFTLSVRCRVHDTPVLGLAPKLALCSNLAGYAHGLARKGVRLVHHRVDGVPWCSSRISPFTSTVIFVIDRPNVVTSAIFLPDRCSFLPSSSPDP